MAIALSRDKFVEARTAKADQGHLRRAVLYDFLAAALSFPVALALRYLGEPGVPANLAGLVGYGILLFLPTCGLAFAAFRVHDAFWRYAAPPELLAIFEAVTFGIAMFGGLLLLLGITGTTIWPVLVIQWFVLICLLLVSRLGYAMLSRWPRAQREPITHAEWEPVIIAGADYLAALLIELLNGPTPSRFQVVGLLDARPGLRGRAIRRVPVLGTIDDLRSVIAQLSVHGIVPRHVVFGLPMECFEPEMVWQLRRSADELGLAVIGPHELLRLAIASGGHSRLHGVSAQPDATRRRAALTRRSIDVVVAAGLLILTAPTFLLIAAILGLSIGRPIIFHQVRPGKGLCPFMLYKFRTLKTEGFTADGVCISDQDRRTAFGHLLRRTRLDELPQLWNVLVGDMSLIGPRPLLARDLPALGDMVHERFSVRPGITGWAQVNGGHSLSTREKVALDLWYIRNKSGRLDLEIVGRTIWMMVFGEHVAKDAVQNAEAAVAAARATSPDLPCLVK